MVNETAKALFDFNGSGAATEWLTVYDSVMDTWPLDDQSNLDDPLSCLLLTAVLPLPTAICHLPTFPSHLPTFPCHLLTLPAYCRSSSAYCLLPSAYSPLPSPRGRTSCGSPPLQ